MPLPQRKVRAGSPYHPRPVPGWRPSTPEVTAATLPEFLERHPLVVVHCWAEWNGHDLSMDRFLQDFRTEFKDQVQFFSCNFDRKENEELLATHLVMNLPCLLFFAQGKWVGRLIASGSDRVRTALTVFLNGRTTSGPDCPQ